MSHKERANAQSIKKKDPDRGPPMIEGAHHFDKGYDSDEETFSPNEYSAYSSHQRGNSYFENTNSYLKKDNKKIERSKFTKYA